MAYFSTRSLQFLRGLKRNNRKPWFEAHRADYDEHVRGPMAELITEMDMRLGRFAPEMVGDPRRSPFRIHRDVRFSSDKAPYKTHASCWFFHGAGSSKVGREAHGGGAGFYFHLEPGASMVAGGCWMPPRPSLNKFRAAIAAEPRDFERIVLAPAFMRRMGALDEESMLKSMPRGYPADHPAAHWLRHQSFTVSRRLTDANVTSGRLTSILETDLLAMLPLVRWLNRTLGLEAERSR